MKTSKSKRLLKNKDVKKVKAQAKCASFDIEIKATIRGRGLVDSELEDIRRKLGHKLTSTVSGLPFSHVYPYEVQVL